MAVKRSNVGFFAFRFFLNTFLFGLGLVLSGYIGLAIFQYYLTSNIFVLPDFQNLDLVGAVNQASRLGIQVEVLRVENHPDLPSNVVLSQSPEAGSEMKRGRTVRVVVNGQFAETASAAGTSTQTVPDVVEMSLDEGRYQLSEAGFRIGRVVEVSHETIPSGLIISQDPPSASTIPVGNQIHLLVSTGSGVVEPVGPVQVTVPDLVGLKLEEARSLLAQRGLTVGAVEETAMSDRYPGIVVQQNPDPGISLNSGEPVRLVVSKEVEGLQEMRLRFPLPEVTVDITVQVVAHDQLGERVVYERIHQGGETVEILTETRGPGKVIIYLNGYYYWEREI